MPTDLILVLVLGFGFWNFVSLKIGTLGYCSRLWVLPISSDPGLQLSNPQGIAGVW